MIYAFSQAIECFDKEEEEDDNIKKSCVSINAVGNFFQGYFHSLLANLMTEEDMLKIVHHMTAVFVDNVKSNTKLNYTSDLDCITWAMQLI